MLQQWHENRGPNAPLTPSVYMGATSLPSSVEKPLPPVVVTSHEIRQAVEVDSALPPVEGVIGEIALAPPQGAGTDVES